MRWQELRPGEAGVHGDGSQVRQVFAGHAWRTASAYDDHRCIAMTYGRQHDLGGFCLEEVRTAAQLPLLRRTSTRQCFREVLLKRTAASTRIRQLRRRPGCSAELMRAVRKSRVLWLASSVRRGEPLPVHVCLLRRQRSNDLECPVPCPAGTRGTSAGADSRCARATEIAMPRSGCQAITARLSGR